MKPTITFFLLFFSFFTIAQSPNIVVILADDMGWNGTQVQLSSTVSGSASDFYETPNLQQMALDGMTFSQGYAPAAKCAPSRNAILTGQSTARNSFTEVGNSIASGEILVEASTNTSIDPNDTTIAEWLESLNLNYRTAHFGKWHIGANGPVDHGFDDGDGATSNNDGNAANGNTIQTDPKKMFELTDKGKIFMQNAVAAGEPFYLHLSHYAVHGGTETTQGSFDHFDAKTPGAIHDNVEFAGMTKDLDEAIGNLLQEIEDLGIAGNTYVIFLSDNGAGNASNNAPLKEGKATIYEGGLRVPFIVKGPNIPANTSCSVPVQGYDIFPTIGAWTGNTASLPTDLDGQSIVPFLNQSTTSRNEPLYFHIPHYTGNSEKIPRSAIVDGKYKLMVDYETGVDYLYHLEDEIGENTNIAGTNPVIYQSLKVKLRDHLKTVNANMPSLDPNHANFSGTGNDVDNDGLDDTWEFTELLNYTFNATDDPDGDGDDNLTEYLNGTDPLVGGNVVTIYDGGFETGWEIWNDGGSDCRRLNNAAFANSGTFSIRLRDDDAASSFMTTNILDLSPFSEITVDFSYFIQSFEDTEDFWLQLSTDGGVTYVTIEDWVHTIDFNNDERHNPSVTISGPFTSNSTLRFRCDASRNNDLVYFDDVVIKGTLASGFNLYSISNNSSTSNSFTQNAHTTLFIEDAKTAISDVQLFPNPTSDNLNIVFELAEADEVEMIISNVFGKIVIQDKWNANEGRQQKNLNSGQLAQGTYFIQLISKNGKMSDSFVVIE